MLILGLGLGSVALALT